MAQSTVDPAALSCCMCLEEVREPITIPCGHSYCSSCIHSHRDRARKKFCCTDGQLPCVVCCTDQHQAGGQRPGELPARRALLLHSLQHKETNLKNLQQEAQDISRSAQRALQQSGESFTQMALLLEKRRSEVERWIRSQEETQLSRVQELQDQLQQDVSELKRSLSELDTLALTQDHNQYCPPLDTDSQHTEFRIQTGPRKDFEDVSRAVSSLRDKLQLILEKAIVQNQEDLSPEPRCREDFLRYARDITLNPDTADPHLALSFGNRRAKFVFDKQRPTDDPDRFSVYQVLSREALTGRCYWELEWDGMVLIAAAYRDTQRDCEFGDNGNSWALDCQSKSYSFWFNKVRTEISCPVRSRRIGVYLDHNAGILSFYCVQGQTMKLLHRVQTQFTQPLYAGVLVGFVSTAHFLKLKS
ncbi:tripartite motif-containing protein 16-like protein [Boleophthalmus pectinirostris]|uniref:tripartite motif-containing protein 16-like protein n=1 Tax=Boleophthalmus pectinirostris TaxID=150288 RepID=UPI00242D12FE|nr:tripartite motif-containing protein 16-like protein [Boleophthalmus pectinirostris]